MHCLIIFSSRQLSIPMTQTLALVFRSLSTFETAGSIELKSHIKTRKGGGTKVGSNGPGHMP